MRKLLTILLFLPLLTSAQLTWEEVEIPMSDGEFLAADLYFPAGWTSGPTILIQTPYWKNFYHVIGLPLGVGYNLDESNYAFVIVDWRGFYGSIDAAYQGAPTRGEDGYDVVEWIAAQDWSNGKVATWGSSALGRVQFQTAQQQPPHLVCMVPQVASPLYLHDEYFPNGVARTEYIERLDELGFGLSTFLYANPYASTVWNFVENANDYPEDILVPTMMIGGWYDHNVETMLQFFPGLVAAETGNLVNAHKLVMGPWTHGGTGTSFVGSDMQGELSYPGAVGWSDSLAMDFIDYYMLDVQNGIPDMARISYFQMGDDQWMGASQWPPAPIENTRYFLHADESLSTDLPQEASEITFPYDPENPCPTIGGPTLRADLDQGPYDQAPLVESREDVLTFTTAPLAGDLVMKGSATVHLRFSSDVQDSDVAVRLCDVYPDGRSMQVCNKIYRLRFLQGFTEADEAMLVPGEIYEVEFQLPSTALTFKEGHSIRIDISGSIYPQYNRNMNTGGEMYPDGNGDTLVNPQIANTTLHFGMGEDAGCWMDFPFLNSIPGRVNEEDASDVLQLSPVPAGDYLQISMSEWKGQGKWRILDASGRVLASSTLRTPQERIDVDALSSGLYFLEVEQDGRMWRKQWVKR